VPVVCSVDGIEAEYQLLPQIGGNKCVITLRNHKNKLNLKQASAGEGYAQYFFLYRQGPGRTNRWQARTTLVGEAPVQWYSTEFGSGGESIEIALGEPSPQLFPCSGFVRGNLEGTIKAPALHLKMLGKDIWAFFLYFATDGNRNYSIRCEKDSLVVASGSTSATATISAVDGNPPKILASVTSNGIDYKKLNLILDSAIGKDSLQDSIQQELTMLTNGENGSKKASWAPVKGCGSEVLWVFSSSGLASQRGPLKDLLEALGAKVNRSVIAGFRDYAGGREMDDFIVADAPEMAYQIGLVLDQGPSDPEINDWAALEFVETTSQTRKMMRAGAEAPENLSNPFLTNPGAHESWRDASSVESSLSRASPEAPHRYSSYSHSQVRRHARATLVSTVVY